MPPQAQQQGAGAGGVYSNQVHERLHARQRQEGGKVRSITPQVRLCKPTVDFSRGLVIVEADIRPVKRLFAVETDNRPEGEAVERLVSIDGLSCACNTDVCALHARKSG